MKRWSPILIQTMNRSHILRCPLIFGGEDVVRMLDLVRSVLRASQTLPVGAVFIVSVGNRVTSHKLRRRWLHYIWYQVSFQWRGLETEAGPLSCQDGGLFTGQSQWLYHPRASH